MCEQCLADVIVFKEQPFRGWTLMRATKDGHIMKAGQWGVAMGDDPSIVWTNTPIIDPCPDSDIDYGSDDIGAWREFDREVETFRDAINCTPNVGYDLVSAAITAGYSRDEDGWLEFWLFDYLAKFIANNPTVMVNVHAADENGIYFLAAVSVKNGSAVDMTFVRQDGGSLDIVLSQQILDNVAHRAVEILASLNTD